MSLNSDYQRQVADCNQTALASLLFWARFWGTVDEWESCFSCEKWCSAHCVIVNECWQAVAREQERAKLRADDRYPSSTA